MQIPSRIATRLLLCCAVVAAPAFVVAQDAAKPAKPAVGTAVAPSETYGNDGEGICRRGGGDARRQV